MMEARPGYLLWSPTDLVNFVACEHLAAIEQGLALGTFEKPPLSDEEQLVMAKGQAHEQAYLERLRSGGPDVVAIAGGADLAGRERAASATHDAMRAGAHVIHGATFVDGNFNGTADFLIRVEKPSALGAWSYEVVDAKLAATAKPAAILQVCAYTDRLGTVLGEDPDAMHLVLGDGERRAFAYRDYAAYYRAVRDRFLAWLAAPPPTYPEPVPQCGRCRWDAACAQRRRDDDHLSEVANIRHGQIAKLTASGITTLTALAGAAPDARVPKLAAETYTRLRRQAELQRATRAGGPYAYDFLEPVAGHGLALLPPPNDGDVYFDMEGDPFYADGGLEYLFGVTYRAPEGQRFTAFWGHDRDGERRALEAFLDFVVERRRSYPGMHVYHYAPYETTAIARLAGRFSTRENEVDALLRERVFVDLYKVVRQSLLLSTDNYSIKSVEKLYRARARTGEVTNAMGSVVAYERWREGRDPAILAQIERYNKDDCDSTLELHAWLQQRRAEALVRFGPECFTAPPDDAGADNDEPDAAEIERDALVAALCGEGAAAGPEERARRLIGSLLTYHRREARPEWREYFARREATIDELIDDPEAFADLHPVDELPATSARSYVYTLTAPPQDTTLRPGKGIDPATGKAVNVVELDPESGIVRIARAKNRHVEPLPRAIVADGPRDTATIAAALARVARSFVDGDGRHAVLRDVLEATPPRLRSGDFQAADGLGVEAIARLALELNESYLLIQGPPGSGKTYTAAHVAVALLRAGKRIGVTSRSHKAIHHLLHKIERAAREADVAFRGLARTRDDQPYVSATGAIESGDIRLEMLPGDGIGLVAGTMWALAPEAMRERLDVLLVDEAGQLSLADAIAVGQSARNLILLGDPQQLAHVSRASHPPLTGISVLEHLLGEERTVAPERGVFLGTTYRMHPEVCAFVSDLMYDGRLHAAPGCAVQSVIGCDPAWSGAGLRALAVEHDGNGRESPEEAEAIADAIARLIGSELVTYEGTRRALTARDIVVVAPYNAQVHRIATSLQACGFGDVPVGTVDKFQGQEAPVVLFSLTSSSGEAIPRGIDFLFSRNRLNVAISRARTLAYLVYSPRLLAIQCKDLEDLRMVNAVARFIELSIRIDAAPQPA